MQRGLGPRHGSNQRRAGSPLPHHDRPSPADSAGEIAGLVVAWYADADPAVCDRMTERMLDYGWGMTGEAGLAECRKLVAEADPAEGVVVGEPSIDGERATVEVTYGAANDRAVDRLDFVLVDGVWNVDFIALVGSGQDVQTDEEA